jgi:hypothetical protein
MLRIVHLRSPLISWIALPLLLACQHEPPPSAPTQTSASNRAPTRTLAVPQVSAFVTPVASTTQPEIAHAAASGCQVMLRLEVQGSQRMRTLRVYGQNLTATPLSFEVPERCPRGLVDFEGLGPGYDYYGTCAAGACAGWPATRRITLAPAQPQPLAEGHIYLDGHAPCTTPLAAGKYRLRASIPSTNVVVCSEDIIFDVPAQVTTDNGSAAPNDPYWCRDSADCVLSCPTAAGCCGHPCGCQHAINIRHRAAYEANYSKGCSRAPCPAVGCAYAPAVLAVCQNHRCVGATTLTGAP